MRHEYKHIINYGDYLALKSRLSIFMQTDKHSIDGQYKIRSIYFDDMHDSCYQDKINGVNKRSKYRLRYYNDDLSYIVLEKKSKINGLCEKIQTTVTIEEALLLLNQDHIKLNGSNNTLIQELCYEMINNGMCAKTIVDYTRDAYVYDAGNVRITLDHHIRTGSYSTDFLNPYSFTMPIEDDPIILEVKYDQFIPTIIKDIIQLLDVNTSSFSKYAECRIYD